MTGASFLGEFGRIRQIFAPLTVAAPGALGLTDDAALIDAGPADELIVTADAMVEGVHFLPSDTPDLIARKLLRSNLSDLAAKAAVPEAYLLTLALPARCDDRWVERFAAGLAQDQAEFGITLIGGDSVSTPGPITLSVTAFGRSKKGTMPRRSGARLGDLVFVSGTIGDAAIGLMAATGGLSSLALEQQHFLRDRYQLPQPRVVLGIALGPVVHAMMDISDGLIADLGHICDASQLGGSIDAAKVPLSDATATALSFDLDLFDRIVGGGDDYELLFTAPPEAEAAIRALALAAGTPVTVIGRICAGTGVILVDRDGVAIPIAQPGYRHA